jgi:hypothetical protein
MSLFASYSLQKCDIIFPHDLSIALTLQVTAASSSACKSKCDIYWRGLERDEPPIPDSSYIARIPGTPAIHLSFPEIICSIILC